MFAEGTTQRFFFNYVGWNREKRKISYTDFGDPIPVANTHDAV